MKMKLLLLVCASLYGVVYLYVELLGLLGPFSLTWFLVRQGVHILAAYVISFSTSLVVILVASRLLTNFLAKLRRTRARK